MQRRFGSTDALKYRPRYMLASTPRISRVSAEKRVRLSIFWAGVATAAASTIGVEAGVSAGVFTTAGISAASAGGAARTRLPGMRASMAILRTVTERNIKPLVPALGENPPSACVRHGSSPGGDLCLSLPAHQQDRRSERFARPRHCWPSCSRLLHQPGCHGLRLADGGRVETLTRLCSRSAPREPNRTG